MFSLIIEYLFFHKQYRRKKRHENCLYYDWQDQKFVYSKRLYNSRPMYDKSPFNEHGILNLIRLGIMGKKVQDEFTPKQIPWGWGGMNWGSGMPMILTKKKQKKIAKALGASRIGGPNKPVKKPTSLK